MRILWLSLGVKLTKPRDVGDLRAPAEDLRRLDLDRRRGFEGDLEVVGVSVGDGQADEEGEEGVRGRGGSVGEGKGG